MKMMKMMKMMKRIKHHFQHEVLKIEWINNEKQTSFSFQSSYFFYLYLSLIGLVSFFALETKPIALIISFMCFFIGMADAIKDSYKRRKESILCEEVAFRYNRSK